MTEQQKNDIADDAIIKNHHETTTVERIKVISVAAVWLIIISNPSKFFIGIGVAPIDTLAELIGKLIIPVIPSFFIAKFISRKTNHSLYKTWMMLTILMLVLMTVGFLRSKFQI